MLFKANVLSQIPLDILSNFLSTCAKSEARTYPSVTPPVEPPKPLP